MLFRKISVSAMWRMGRRSPDDQQGGWWGGCCSGSGNTGSDPGGNGKDLNSGVCNIQLSLSYAA